MWVDVWTVVADVEVSIDGDEKTKDHLNNLQQGYTDGHCLRQSYTDRT